MAAQGYFLTEGDKDALSKVLRLIQEHGPEILKQPEHAQPDNLDITGTTQCYIARTPQGGIPPLVKGTDPELRLRERDGKNTYHNTDDVPGKALCDIYRIVRGGKPLADHLTPLPVTAEWVYNLSLKPVPEKEWIDVVREKNGSWIFKQAAGDDSAIVRIPKDPLTDGPYVQGFVQFWNELTLQWLDVEEVWVLDANNS